jgi:hypothetical protein
VDLVDLAMITRWTSEVTKAVDLTPVAPERGFPADPGRGRVRVGDYAARPEAPELPAD